MEIPDLAEANFENLTITAQLRVIERLVGSQSVALIGSSLGGYLAALYASRHLEVDRLVLLAPAFGFLDLWKGRLGPDEMARWQRTNQLPVYHYGEQQQRNLGFQLMPDAAGFPPVPSFSQPVLLFHGQNDDTVPVSSSVHFASTQSNATLMRLDSDHELGDVLDQIWKETKGFLLSAPPAKSVLG